MAAHIVLSTLNAKYIHASLGLRYLLANMGELRPDTALREYSINRPVAEIVTDLISHLPTTSSQPIIVGLGVYIWNIEQSTALAEQLKALRPDLILILGGPEISYETGQQTITAHADYVITGWGDVSFPQLCRDILAERAPAQKIIPGVQAPLHAIALPYEEFSAEDLAHRLLYVEASRGCPFKCEFCLSALDKTAWPFELERFLTAMDALYQRGARHFKFVDRTFNLKIETSARILEFFLARIQAATPGSSPLFLHFELVPDHLPERLKQLIVQFPPGCIQFEIGIQSFNPEVQQRISRRQDNNQTEENLRWLMAQSHAHLHTDLIFGLPGENLASFRAGFDRLYRLGPHEIQLGILKRLRGTPIVRHSEEFAMHFATAAPYTIEHNRDLDRETVLAFSRLARYWEILANSGRFERSLALLMDEQGAPEHSPFQAFWDFSLWFWGVSQRTNRFTPEYLVDSLHHYLCEIRKMDRPAVQAALLADYQGSGARAQPNCLQGLLSARPVSGHNPGSALQKRQQQHLPD